MFAVLVSSPLAFGDLEKCYSAEYLKARDQMHPAFIDKDYPKAKALFENACSKYPEEIKCVIEKDVPGAESFALGRKMVFGNACAELWQVPGDKKDSESLYMVTTVKPRPTR